ncbi:hypothetical protein KW798_03570, partial [Candidatus Parcubacteria bacterium]|nr:hypothetical protein [Candidatus Parcubacteria bacterium]
ERIKSAYRPTVEQHELIKASDDVFKIVKAVYDSGQVRVWPDRALYMTTKVGPDGLPEQDQSGRIREVPREVYLVRRDDEGYPVLSPEKVKMPRRPAQFINALEEFVDEAPWPQVTEFLKSTEGGTNVEQIQALEDAANEIQSFEDAGEVAKNIHATFPKSKDQDKLMGYLSRVLNHFLGQRALLCEDISKLKALHTEMTSFFKTSNGRFFRQVTFMDVLDNRAFELGKDLLTQAITPEQVTKALEGIGAYPFEFAFAYDQSFTESREDALAKIELLSKIRLKRTEKGLDQLKKEVETYPFQSQERSAHYRQQINNFIERKREAYFSKKSGKISNS